MKIHFKKLFSILCVIVLLFSLAVPAFADDSIQVQDGYNIDCVPYSPYISSLVVTDNTEEASVYYSASKARTYSATASTFSVSRTSSDTSTDYLYSFHDMWNIFSSESCNPQGWRNVYIRPEIDGYNYTYYESFETYNYFKSNKKSLPEMKAANKYHVTFRLRGFNGDIRSYGSVQLSLIDSANSSNSIVLYSYTMLNSSTGGQFVYDINFDGNVIIPETWSGTVCLYLELTSLTGGTYTFGLNDFTVVDITNENLDKSLDKFGDRLENVGSSEPSLDTDISAFQSAIDTMNGWLDQLDEFADSIDAAGQTANEYISKGTEIFNGFMSVAPAAVIALVAFGVVFIVVRKIVGR